MERANTHRSKDKGCVRASINTPQADNEGTSRNLNIQWMAQSRETENYSLFNVVKLSKGLLQKHIQLGRKFFRVNAWIEFAHNTTCNLYFDLSRVKSSETYCFCYFVWKPERLHVSIFCNSTKSSSDDGVIREPAWLCAWGVGQTHQSQRVPQCKAA